MTERIMLIPNPPTLSDEAAATITQFLFDIAMAAEMHYGCQLRRHYRNKANLHCENQAEDDSDPF